MTEIRNTFDGKSAKENILDIYFIPVIENMEENYVNKQNKKGNMGSCGLNVHI